MVTAKKLAEIVEGDSVMEVDSIEEADRECPACGGSVLAVTYMPSVTELATGWKCQDCEWSETERN